METSLSPTSKPSPCYHKAHNSALFRTTPKSSLPSNSWSSVVTDGDKLPAAAVAEVVAAVTDANSNNNIIMIFLDMAILVDAHGDMLNNIEAQVSSAVNHVQSGNTVLQKAKSLQKSSRKWMCIAILILLIIVITIVVAVLKPWSGNKGA